jgi:hypothetical protein
MVKSQTIYNRQMMTALATQSVFAQENDHFQKQQVLAVPKPEERKSIMAYKKHVESVQKTPLI